MIVLGIETTCDETSISLVKFENQKFEIISNVVLSQDIHSIFGGVFPEKAFRKHQENMVPVLKKALVIDIQEIDIIGVSAYPGLLGALAAGVATAKTIASLLDKPVIPVNHLWAHFLVNFIDKEITEVLNKKYLGIVISGGHTSSYLIESLIPLKITSISRTLDDAVGESFDKVARMLNLGFPGGPIIDKMAQEYKKETNLNDFKPIFPIPNPSDYSFSYSGLKTAVKRYIEQNKELENSKIKEICYHFQYSAIKHLVQKIEKIIIDFGIGNVLIGGGVAANSFLRDELNDLKQKYNLEILIPPVNLCTDNAVMVAIAAVFLYLSYPNIPNDFDIFPNEDEGNRLWNMS